MTRSRIWAFIGKHAMLPCGVLIGHGLMSSDVIEIALGAVMALGLRARTAYVFGLCDGALDEALGVTHGE